MIQGFYDDYYHIGKACSVLESHWNYRPLLYWINCALGESIFNTRLLSLIFIILTFIGLLKAFGLFYNKNRFFYFLIFFNCTSLWPYFYASQISASLSVFWAVIPLLISIRNSRINCYEYLFFATWAIVGSFIRVETIMYYIFLVGAYACYQFIDKNLRVRDFLKCFNKNQYKKIFIFLSFYLLISYLNTKGYLSSLFQLNWSNSHIFYIAASMPIEFYPKESHIAVQIWAIFLYFKNLIWPWSLSFFGPWSDWITIHKEISLQVILYTVFIALILFNFMIIISRNIYKSRKFFFAGVLLFLALSFAFSIYMRVDWYYPMRAYLPSLIWSLFLCLALSYCSDKKIQYHLSLGLLIVLNISSLIYLTSKKFESRKKFLSHEVSLVAMKSPKLLNEIGHYNLIKGRTLEAHKNFFDSYAIFDESLILNFDKGIFHSIRLDALYGGYITSRLLNKDELSFALLKKLMEFNYPLSTLACIQDERTNHDVCLAPNRRVEFCKHANSIINPMKVFFKTEKNLNEICDE